MHTLPSPTHTHTTSYKINSKSKKTQGKSFKTSVYSNISYIMLMTFLREKMEEHIINNNQVLVTQTG